MSQPAQREEQLLTLPRIVRSIRSAQVDVVAVADLAAGTPVVLVDDVMHATGPQLLAAADRIDAETMAFIVRYSSGFVSVCLPAARCDQLLLPVFANDRGVIHEPLSAVSVDARFDVGTGISAADRSRTARLLADPRSVAGDFTRPGHVVPLRVPESCGRRAEAMPAVALGLCAIAGASVAAVISDLVDDEDANPMSDRDANEFATRRGLRCVMASEIG
jgi:3,4-dihydroxy 2-butanone 4-phosphate synthase/GTP cyclohydrolase II